MKATSCLALTLVLALFAGCSEELKGPKGPQYRTAPILKTDIVRTVEATGTVTPRNSSSGIPVGAQVNGKIIKLFVDYNSNVTNGQIVALIDPLVYEATYKASVAKFHMAQANVVVQEASISQRKAALDLAEKTLARKQQLIKTKMCSQADLDSAVEACETARAQLASAEASLLSARANVEQCEADMNQARANLDYCTIRSPVNGIVIARKVEEGETVVSSMNAVPVLTIAEDLETIWIEATVPEADVGNIKIGQKVTFTADAYRRHFEGTVKQIRKASTTTNNVVTFPVIIEAENPDEMLFPGMTATLSIETARAEGVPAVSTAAFRFRPKADDRVTGEVPEKGDRIYLAPEKPGEPLEVVAVNEGITDDSFTEVTAVDGRSLEGRKAVLGYATVASQMQEQGASNPFMPKPPAHGTKGTAPAPKK